MYELIQAAPRAYYIQCPAKMGLWVPDGQHAVLIDSGGDKDAGRKVPEDPRRGAGTVPGANRV